MSRLSDWLVSFFTLMLRGEKHSLRGTSKNESGLNCSGLPPFVPTFLIGHDFNFWFTPFSQPSYTIHCRATAAWCPATAAADALQNLSSPHLYGLLG